MTHEMTEAARLRRAAEVSLREASRAHELAADLATRAAVLVDRLTPVVRGHTADVWSSTAAEESRRRVRILHDVAVRGVADDLSVLRAALQQRATELEGQARAQQLEADRLEALLAVTLAAGLGGGGIA